MKSRLHVTVTSRCCRFSPFFRSKLSLSLSNVTFSNKIDPRRNLCSFDLTGKCHDKKCVAQHHADLAMSTAHLLVDLASYAGNSLSTDAGIHDAKSRCEAEVRKFATNFRSARSKMVKGEDLCLLMLDKVNEMQKQGWLCC